ncbi:uncharacterized protein LOC128549064 [Mercenaria mercenaria]|uniref:uncharacterized protein LOC128549064 n=1 Tax=Mercenaria mercenaria TaxID=6596 RepID=UPI00234E6E2A|nr:uncharacterized protein LOC128549064 [Mercenaria mercenaria]
MTNTEDINKRLPPETSEADPSTWDISIIASVILISFPFLSLDEVTKIERIRDARNQYAVTALSLVAQESDDLFEQSAVLIHSLTSLSADLELQTKQKLDLMIQQYPKFEVHDGDTIDKYLNELGKHGANIKSIEDLYKEHMDQLRNTLREMNENGIHFKTPHEIQIKLVTVCEEEETKRNAEDTLEKVYNTALANDGVNTSLSPSNHLDKEVETLIRRFSGHPDVTASGIKRNCITLFLSCSSCQGILHVIDYIGSQHFEKIQSRISDELSYMYGEAFAVRGNIPLESICGVLKDPRNERGQVEGGLSVAIECSSSEGIRHVLSLLSDNETTNSFNHISDMLSSKYDKKVSVQGFADLKVLSDLYEETDTDTSDSLKDLNEDDWLCAQNITDVEGNVTPTYLETESQTLRESRSKRDSVRTEQRFVEDSQSDKKPNPEHEFSKEEDGVLTETELQYQDEDVQMGTGTIEEDESQFNMNNIKETAQILYELQNRVGKIKNEIVTTANEVSSLYVDKTSVPVSSVESQHQKGITESILIEDKRNQPYSEDHEKDDTSKEMSPSLLSEINESTCASLKQTLKEMKSIISRLTDCVSTWKDNFKLVYVGLADYQEIDEIASRCSRIGRYIHDLHHEILPLLFNIHVECGWATKELDIYEHKLDSLFNDFTKSTFLVTEQDNCFIRMDGRKHLPVLTVRILAAENLPPHFDKIEAMLLSESDINDSFDGNDDMKQFSMKAKERSLHLTSNQIYFTPTRHASFRKLKIKNKYPPEEFTSGEQEYKVKYRTVFTTTLADRPYWTLSLPMTMLHDSVPDQKFLASTSIMWQCWGADVFKLPLQSDTGLPWTKVEEFLQAKFLKLHPLTPLSDGNILYLKEMLFGTTDVPDSWIVSFEEFCINGMESTSSTRTFWKWVTDAYNVIEKYLIDFWKNGLILGFISKEEAELRLKDYNTLKHGTFILRFSDHHLPNNGNVQNVYGQLNAYVLTITEENVAISYLASSVYRTLGEYLNRNDSKTAEPRWVFLIKQSDLPISESDQRHIEDATKPGVIFLDEMEKLLYKIPDLAGMLREHGMHDGLEILHSSEVNEDSVLALSEYVFRKIGRALEESHAVQVPGGQPESCWDYIINHDNTLNITRKDQRNIGNSLNPGEKFLEIFDFCKHTLTDLKILCKTYKMQGILDILASSRQEGYLQKTLIDVHIGGEREFREQKLLDILKEKRSPDGCQMFRYLYPGLYTLDELCGKYT